MFKGTVLYNDPPRQIHYLDINESTKTGSEKSLSPFCNGWMFVRLLSEEDSETRG